MTEAEREQVARDRASGKKITVLDRADRPPKPAPEKRQPERGPKGLTRKSRRKLNVYRRKRVKVEARDVGFMLFRYASPGFQKRIRDLEAIMQDARSRDDNRALRAFYRALVDGLIEAVRSLPEDPSKRSKPTTTARKRRKGK